MSEAPLTPTVRQALQGWVAAARGALAWHVEGGDLELAVPEDFALPPLGRVPARAVASGAAAEPAGLARFAPRPEVAEAVALPGRPMVGSEDPAALAQPQDGSRSSEGSRSSDGDAADACLAEGPRVGAPAARLPAAPPSAPVAPGFEPPPALPRPSSARGVAALALDAVAVDLGPCTRCRLCQGRQEIVFGAGAADARLLFVGDAPGPAEDALGLPFADEAGALLGKMVRAMGLSRQSVYLTYLLKCHPGKREAGPEAWAACQPFFDRQLEAIRPQAIVALGEFAARVLCASEASMPRLRGQWGTYRGVPVLPTFSPVALVQNPEDRRLRAWVWDDLKKVMRHLGLAPPES